MFLFKTGIAVEDINRSLRFNRFWDPLQIPS